MNHKQLAEALIDRLVFLGVNMRKLPLLYLDEVCRGNSMMVVARNQPCPVCGFKHLISIAMVKASKDHPKKLFRK